MIATPSLSGLDAAGAVTLDDRSDTRRWTGSLAAVLAVHSLPLLVAIYWLGPMASPPPPEPTIMIDMAPLSPEPPQPTPPQPEPTPQPRIETPQPTAVKDPVRTPPIPNPAVSLPQRPPEPPRPAPRPATPPAPVQPAVAQPSNAAPTWQGLVLGRLNAVKRYPPLAFSRRQQGIPYIRFVMNRSGKVLSSRIERSSGFPLLDQEAIALPKRAQPLPPPPDSVPGETIELVFPLEFFLK